MIEKLENHVLIKKLLKLKTMDYEKLHKTSLEIGRELIQKCPEMKDWVVRQLPELAESEDERMFKAIAEGIRDLVGDFGWSDFGGIPIEDILAWLEKQDKKELVETKNEKIREALISVLTSDFEKDTTINDITVEEIVDWLEKQGKKECALKSLKDEDVRKFMQYFEKQAKAYEIELPNRSYDIYGLAKDILAWLEKQGEQKPVDWSQEDSYMLRQAIRCVNNSGKLEVSTEEIEYWLESLKGRLQPQPKQEWSVEDRSKIQRICIYLNEAKKYYADITEVRECIDWLKSLKPQSQWKPSEVADGKVVKWDDEDKRQFEREMWDKCNSYIHDLME